MIINEFSYDHAYLLRLFFLFLIMSNRQVIQGAKSEAESVAKETGEKIEKWLVLKIKDEIDSDELEALLNARRRTVRQFLNSQEIAVKAQLEKVTIGLIDLVLNKALDAIL